MCCNSQFTSGGSRHIPVLNNPWVPPRSFLFFHISPQSSAVSLDLLPLPFPPTSSSSSDAWDFSPYPVRHTWSTTRPMMSGCGLPSFPEFSILVTCGYPCVSLIEAVNPYSHEGAGILLAWCPLTACYGSVLKIANPHSRALSVPSSDHCKSRNLSLGSFEFSVSAFYQQWRSCTTKA